MLVARTILSPSIGKVTQKDLERLGDLHALLFALDDPSAAVDRVADLCTRLPALEERLVAVARARAPVRTAVNVRSALSLLGNRALEKVLLELLEDLTVLKYDVESAEASRTPR